MSNVFVRISSDEDDIFQPNPNSVGPPKSAREHPDIFMKALSYVRKVKNRFCTVKNEDNNENLFHEPSKYDKFMDALTAFGRRHITAQELHDRMTVLFVPDHKDLLEGFELFVFYKFLHGRHSTVPNSDSLRNAKGNAHAERQPSAPPAADFELHSSTLADSVASYKPGTPSPPQHEEGSRGVNFAHPQRPRARAARMAAKSARQADSTQAPTAIKRPASGGKGTGKGTYVHSICGQPFTRLDAVRVHHFGKGDSEGCWGRHGKPDTAWDAHPSCARSRSSSATGTEPTTTESEASALTITDTSTGAEANTMSDLHSDASDDVEMTDEHSEGSKAPEVSQAAVTDSMNDGDEARGKESTDEAREDGEDGGSDREQVDDAAVATRAAALGLRVRRE